MKTNLLTATLIGISVAAAAAGAAPEPPGSAETQEFVIPLERQQMIGVTYAAAEVRPLRRMIRAAGTVAETTGRRWTYVTRVDGYVRAVKVGSPGERVEKGQAVLEIYSPDLVSTEEEFLDLLRMQAHARAVGDLDAAESAGRLQGAARERLRQWDVSDAQMDAVAQSGHSQPYLELLAPIGGILREVPVVQGQRVAAGDRLIEVVDLSSVWVWADVFEEELPLVREGMDAVVLLPGAPGLRLPGRIEALDPVIDESKRAGRARITLENPGLRLRPGAYVDVELAVDEGTGLTIPVDAVLPTGDHDVVFVDRGEGRLEPRFVSLGGRFGPVYRVKDGLREGDRVVASAGFLVDSESKVQGAIRSK
jgi:Cu(I)/Ag(I) efflux system membrane fusion protein